MNTLKNAKIIFKDMEKVIKLIHSSNEHNEDPFYVSSEQSGSIRTI